MLELNRIYNMDCLEGLKLIPDKSIDLVVTDPPYRFENKGGGFYAHNKSTRRLYLQKLDDIKCTTFQPVEFLEVLKPKMKVFYGYFFCNKFLITDYVNWAKKNKYNFDLLVMGKTNPIPAYNSHHLSDLEYIVMIREKGSYFSKHNRLDDYRKFYLTNCRKGVHPAEKPVELIERYIRVSSQENDLILDPFMGSGTTAVACINTGRNFIGFEISEEYCKIAEKRISEAISNQIEPPEIERNVPQKQFDWLDELLEG